MEKTSSNDQVLLLFDVYGTLLDMSDVKRKVNRMMNNKTGYMLWSETLLHYCLVDNITNPHSFTDIANAAMKMTARSLEANFSNDGFEEILEMFRHLPLQEGAMEGISFLQDRNYKFAALTNFPETIVMDRMERTGFISYFERIISTGKKVKYKPDPSAYHYALKQSETESSQTIMITSHGWDIIGAGNCGIPSAYIERGGEIIYPLAQKPDYIAKDISDLAKQLTEKN